MILLFRKEYYKFPINHIFFYCYFFVTVIIRSWNYGLCVRYKFYYLLLVSVSRQFMDFSGYYLRTLYFLNDGFKFQDIHITIQHPHTINNGENLKIKTKASSSVKKGLPIHFRKRRKKKKILLFEGKTNRHFHKTKKGIVSNLTLVFPSSS